MILEVLTGALVVITGFYAWVTFQIMKANKDTVATMREQTESVTRPYISMAVFTVPNNPIFYLRIANRGRTGATNVQLTLDRDFYQYGDRKTGTNLRIVKAFQQPIEQLPPGAELIFALATHFAVFAKDANSSLTPRVFTITATYSYGNKTVTENTVIDLEPYFGSTDLPSAVADELVKIREELAKIANKG